MKKKLIENWPFTWHWKTISELSFANRDFSKLTESNLEWFEIVGIDFQVHEWKFINWRLHVIKKWLTRKTYKKLKNWLKLDDIFSNFHNIEIKTKKYWIDSIK